MRPLPKFVDNAAIWQYVLTKFEDDYEDWGPQEFKKAQVVYRNAKRKYADDDLKPVSMSNVPTAVYPSEPVEAGLKACSSCEKPAQQFYVGDYMCRTCRDS